jgi:hypothetical protein
MRKVLEFQTIAVDTLTLRKGQTIHAGESTSLYGDYDESDGENVTGERESEILKWLMESSFRDLLLNKLDVSSDAFIARDVARPVIENPQGKPGDIDLLICDGNRADQAIAFQCKRVKVKAFNQDDDDVNKLSNITGGVKQANFQRNNLGFHRNYLVILIEAYGKKRAGNNVLFRGPNQETFKAIYEFPMRESLHSDVGVIFIEISQPTGKSFRKMAVVGVCIDQEAARLDQPPVLTNRIRELIREKSSTTF